MDAYTHIRSFAFIHTYIHTSYTCIYIPTSYNRDLPTYLPACLPTYLPTDIPTYIRSCIAAHLHYVHTCTHTDLYIYIYIRTQHTYGRTDRQTDGRTDGRASGGRVGGRTDTHSLSFINMYVLIMLIVYCTHRMVFPAPCVGKHGHCQEAAANLAEGSMEPSRTCAMSTAGSLGNRSGATVILSQWSMGKGRQGVWRMGCNV